MRILTVDIGTGTQDIFLYDSRLDIENGFKMILPSPTMIVHQRLKEATRAGQAVFLMGVTTGGGPSQWAAEAHVSAGFPLYATPEAARSFNDDLDVVRAMGIQVVSEDEARRLPDSILRLVIKDFDFAAIARAFHQFGVSFDNLRAVAVAVFDHGNAPPGYSNRQFRFDYLDERIRAENCLSAFAYRPEDVPKSMTRLQAVVESARGIDAPLVVMDTAPAAVLGATYDDQVASSERVMIVNVGNFHTLAFRLAQMNNGTLGIEGLFEHHTGLLDLPKLEKLLYSLAESTLKHEEVFGDHGHGALIYNPEPFSREGHGLRIVVTGPRRNLLKNSMTLRPHYAVPFGDMMMAGNIGLLAATADIMPELSDPIRASLKGEGGSGGAPWELE